MTTLHDYLFDLAKNVLQAEHEAQDENKTLTDEAINEMVDEAITNIKARLIGGET